MNSDNERGQTSESEETEAKPKESGMRGLFGKARSAVSDGLERAQDTATPHVDRVREAASPHVERATEIASPHVERGVDAYQKAVGAEFRDEFTRYVNAATTTIVGLHQDQTATQERVGQLESDVKVLQQRIADLEDRQTG